MNELFTTKRMIGKNLSIRIVLGFMTGCLLLIAFPAMAQRNLSGNVVNELNEPIEGAHVYLQETKQIALTDEQGYFQFVNLFPKLYRLHVSYLGYKCIHPYRVSLIEEDQYLTVIMEPENIGLDEVVITASTSETELKGRPDATIVAGRGHMEQHRDHSLIKTLDRLPGLQAMEIGQGASKPIIRGLGLNRVVVTENNTRMEGQQWGADHGLEIDQYAAEWVEIVKGPSSLRYGSEAIGGTIRIGPHAIASPNTLESNLDFTGHSVNDLLAASLMLRLRTNKYYNYLRYTQSDFGNYKVPADQFTYNTYRFPLKDGHILNTGGQEQSVYLTNGIIQPWGKVALSVSNFHSRIGFFPGAHGLPDMTVLENFPIQRNIDLPFQQVNHFKISGNTKVDLNNIAMEADFAFQQNHRQEWSKFHSHFPDQKEPQVKPDLELEWLLNTLSSDIRARSKLGKSETEAGISLYSQFNEIGGYMFLLPEFKRIMAGAFVYNQIEIADQLRLSGGLRYDLGHLRLEPYFSPYTNSMKSPDFKRLFHNLSWAFGMVYDVDEHTTIRTNIAKGFRVPTASEIGSNGIHHGSFRYELGDTMLNSEIAYQFDAGLSIKYSGLTLSFGPFAGYFPNYIYLNPTGSYLLPDGSPVAEAGAGQVYQYIQSEAYRFGGELTATYRVNNLLKAYFSTEYVYASDGSYPIPLTPPLNLFLQLEYKLPEYWNRLHQSQILIETRYSASQNRNARNEEPTDAWYIVNLQFSTKIITRGLPISLNMRVQNLLDQRYWNHLNYYRQIGIPEAGRNIQLSIKIPLQTKLRK